MPARPAAMSAMCVVDKFNNSMMPQRFAVSLPSLIGSWLQSENLFFLICENNVEHKFSGYGHEL